MLQTWLNKMMHLRDDENLYQQFGFVWLGGERKGGMGIRSGCKDGFRVHRKGYKYHTERVELGVDKSFSHLRDMITKEVSQKKYPHTLQG